MPRNKRKATPAPLKPPRTLTDFQEHVCNCCADLVLNGGDEDDVSNLLRAVIGHSLHLRWPGYDTCHRSAEDVPDWRKRLARYWPKKIEPDHELPKTVTEMLRANLRGALGDKFTSFLARARMHEIYLLNDVLGNFESEGSDPLDKNAESMLARAFLQELRTDYSYLKVPDDHVEAVEEFLKHIDETASGEAPEPIGRPKLLAFQPRQAIQDESDHAS